MTKTKHTHRPNFGRKVSGCPRCLELANGAALRAGWNDLKIEFEKEQIRAIKNHRCSESNCGPVCTAFNW